MKKLHAFLLLLYNLLIVLYCQAAASYKDFADTLVNEEGSKTTAELLKEFNEQQQSFKGNASAKTFLAEPFNAKTCLEVLSIHFKEGKFPFKEGKFPSAKDTDAFTPTDYDNLKNLIIKLLEVAPTQPLTTAFQNIIQSPECTVELIKAFEDAGLEINAKPYSIFAFAALPTKGSQKEDPYKIINYLIDKSLTETLNTKISGRPDTLGLVLQKIGNNKALIDKLLYTKKVTVTERHLFYFFESKNINTNKPGSRKTLEKLITAISPEKLFKALTEISLFHKNNIRVSGRSKRWQEEKANLEAIFTAIQGNKKFAPITKELENYFKDKINPPVGDNNDTYNKYGKILWDLFKEKIEPSAKERIEKAAQAYKTEKEAEIARKQEEERLQQEKEKKEEERSKKVEEQRKKSHQEEEERGALIHQVNILAHYRYGDKYLKDVNVANTLAEWQETLKSSGPENPLTLERIETYRKKLTEALDAAHRNAFDENKRDLKEKINKAHELKAQSTLVDKDLIEWINSAEKLVASENINDYDNVTSHNAEILKAITKLEKAAQDARNQEKTNKEQDKPNQLVADTRPNHQEDARPNHQEKEKVAESLPHNNSQSVDTSKTSPKAPQTQTPPPLETAQSETAQKDEQKFYGTTSLALAAGGAIFLFILIKKLRDHYSEKEPSQTEEEIA